VGTVLPQFLGLTLTREVLHLARGRFDGEPLWKKEILGVAVGYVLDLTWAAETADLALEDDAHACL
jgi:hypothetical protein